MTFFTASFETVLIRYYLMMAVIVGSFTLGYPLLAFLSLPLFLLAITATSFKTKQVKTNQHSLSIDIETKEVNMMNTAA